MVEVERERERVVWTPITDMQHRIVNETSSSRIGAIWTTLPHPPPPQPEKEPVSNAHACTARRTLMWRYPTSNALLMNFRLKSDAEILLLRHRLGLQIGAKCAKTCMQRVRIPTALPFCVPPLVVGQRNKCIVIAHGYFRTSPHKEAVSKLKDCFKVAFARPTQVHFQKPHKLFHNPRRCWRSKLLPG